MRIFLAVFPPAAAQDLAFGVIEGLRRPGDGVSWVKRDNLHYTLRFLGEIGEDGLRRATEAAREAASGGPAFDAMLGACGAFPSAKRARVLWLGLAAGEEPLLGLARRLETALARRGFAPEGRDFSAHLTIGRVREPGPDWGARLAAVKSLEGGRDAGFRVSALSVMKSTLSPKGSIYEVIAAAPLA